MMDRPRVHWLCGWWVLMAVGQLLAAEPKPPRKLALLVGIGAYDRYKTAPGARQWNPLHVRKDVEELAAVLRDRYGFSYGTQGEQHSDIAVLLDERATKEEITRVFNAHLIKQAEPGSTVVFYYAGHGQEIPDDNCDEPNGLDQALVPFDYQTQGATEGAPHRIRDDDVGKWLSALSGQVNREGKQGSITVVLDCCHAGTATRGDQIERGRSWRGDLDGPRPQPCHDQAGAGDSNFIQAEEARRGDFVVVCACESTQSAAEDEIGGEYRGLMSYHLIRALAQAGPRTSYREIQDRLQADVKPHGTMSQTPIIEGNVDQVLFGRGMVEAPRYVLVRTVREADPPICLAAGELHGVTSGSVFDVYAPGQAAGDAAARPLFQVTVTDEVEATRSWAKPIGKVAAGTLKQAQGGRAVERSHRYSDDMLKVQFAGTPDWQERLKSLNVVQPIATGTRGWDLQLRRQDGRLTFVSPDNRTVKAVADSPDQVDAVAGFLRQNWRWRYVKDLRSQSGDDGPAQVQMRIVPVKAVIRKGRLEGWSRLPADAQKGNQMRLRGGNRALGMIGDPFAIEVRNASPVPMHVAVIDLRPNGGISVLYPSAAGQQQNLVPNTGEWVLLKNSPTQPGIWQLKLEPEDQAERPESMEIFKLVATREYAHYDYLEQDGWRRGGVELPASRGEVSPFRRLWDLAAQGTRGEGAESLTVPVSGWATAEAVVYMVPQ